MNRQDRKVGEKGKMERKDINEGKKAG